MNRINPCVQALVVLAVSLTAPFVVPFLLMRARWDSEATWKDDVHVIRGQLTLGNTWYGTPDEPLPGGMYEPSMQSLYLRFGRWICSYVWLGLRNRAHGFSMKFSEPMTGYFEEKDGLVERDGLWRYRVPLGPLCFVAGYRSYHTPARGYYGTPVFTIKRA